MIKNYNFLTVKIILPLLALPLLMSCDDEVETKNYTTNGGWDYNFTQLPKSEYFSCLAVAPTKRFFRGEVNPFSHSALSYMLERAGTNDMLFIDKLAKLEDLDASASVYFNQNSANLFLSTKLDVFEEFMDIMIPNINDPVFNEEALVDYKNEAEHGIEQSNSLPINKIINVADKYILGDNEIISNIDFNQENLEALTFADIKDRLEEVKSASGWHISCAGPNKPTKLDEYIDRIFIDFNQDKIGIKSNDIELNLDSNLIVIEDEMAKVASYNEYSLPLSNNGLDQGIIESIYFEIMASSDMDTRLARIRNDLRGSYGMNFGIFDFLLNKPMSLIQGELDPKIQKESYEIIREITQSLKTDGFSEEEIEFAREKLKDNIQNEYFEESSNFVFLTSNLLLGEKDYNLHDFLKRLDELTASQINEIFKNNYFDVDAYLTIIHTPLADDLPADCVIKDASEIDKCF